MSTSEYIFATSRPYSSLLREVSVLGRLFRSKHLSFNMQAQTQSNWCWAATSTSVSHFYWFFSHWTQCKVANAELGHTDCCHSPVPSDCNVPWYLDRALTRTNNFVSIAGPAGFQQVKDEIDAGRPVGARIGWSGGGGHFMVIYGYSIVFGVEYFDIDDPIYGKSHLTVTDFSNNYQGSGSWTHTYFTKSYFKMPIKVLIPDEWLLRRIWEARPLLNVKQDLNFSGEVTQAMQDGRVSLCMAHRVYSLGLDALTSERAAEPQLVGMRVFELAEDKPQAYFDLSEEAEPRVMQMSSSESHIKQFSKGLERALSEVEKLDKEAELRLFRVPALNFEALWINYADETTDMLVPLRDIGKLAANKPVPLDEALIVLREAARPLLQMDDTMGA
jgi:hypothetical protein